MNGPEHCTECAEYLAVRMPVIVPAITKRALATGEEGRTVASRFMAGVHLRHLSGKPILPQARAS